MAIPGARVKHAFSDLQNRTKYRPRFAVHQPLIQSDRMHTGANMSEKYKVQLQRIKNIEDFYERSPEIDTMINEMPAQGLAELFPELLALIFGYGGYPGWKLKLVDRKSCTPQCFDRALFFMSTGGQLFKMIDKLAEDTTLKFHFPIECLSEKVRVNLEKGVISPFYQDKVSPVSTSQISAQLELSAFEYYFFLFAYYIVRPTSVKEKNLWSRLGDNLYISILEHYLNFFLPTDGSEISAQTLLISGREVTHSRTGRNSSPYSRQSYTSPQSVFKVGSSILSSGLPLDYLDRPTWKSETFVQILVEFWLTQCSRSSPVSLSNFTRESNLPSEEQILTVRMLVKHVHAFANCGRTKLQSLGQFHGDHESHTDEFKRMIIPLFLQKEMYEFLKHTFARWPLDPSFKMVLETWLSYIQPWRYTAGSYCEGTENENLDLSAWKNFIAENILFYLTFLKMFLPRALRFDLRSTGVAYQLLRVTKVFSQANLIELLREVDQQNLTSAESHIVRQLGPPHQTNVSYLGLQRISQYAQLEEPGFVYESLFSDNVTCKCEELATKLSETVIKLRSEEIRRRREKIKRRGDGFLNRLKRYITGEPEQEEMPEEKLLDYLERSYSSIVDIFQLPLPETIPEIAGNVHQTVTSGLPRPRFYSDASEDGRDLPDCFVTETGYVLTPKGRFQLINGVRQFDIGYRGDPELQPIRSYETTSLVRSLFQLSSVINERWKEQLSALYNRQDVLGTLLRGLAAGPEVSSSEYRQPPAVELEARVSLRFLASHYTLAYFMWILLLLRLLGFGIFGLLVLFLVMLLFAVGNNVRLVVKKSKTR